jgi:hypothetical protein
VSDQARLHIGVILGEGPRSSLIFALEQHDSTVRRIREGSSEYELASFLSFPGQTQVLAPVWHPALHVVIGECVEKQKMHDALQADPGS